MTAVRTLRYVRDQMALLSPCTIVHSYLQLCTWLQANGTLHIAGRPAVLVNKTSGKNS